MNLLFAVAQVMTTIKNEMKASRLVNIYYSALLSENERRGGRTVRMKEIAPDRRLEAEWRSEKNVSVPKAAVSATRI